RSAGKDRGEGRAAAENHVPGCLRAGPLPRDGGGRVRPRARRARTVWQPRPPSARTGRPDRPPQVMKTRLDRLLVDRGLAPSREKAQAMIMAGEVLVGGQKAEKPGQSFPADVAIDVLARPPYVSRGGVKLAAALDAFAIDPAGKVCLDAGASTGGF